MKEIKNCIVEKLMQYPFDEKEKIFINNKKVISNYAISEKLSNLIYNCINLGVNKKVFLALANYLNIDVIEDYDEVINAIYIVEKWRFGIDDSQYKMRILGSTPTLDNLIDYLSNRDDEKHNEYIQKKYGINGTDISNFYNRKSKVSKLGTALSKIAYRLEQYILELYMPRNNAHKGYEVYYNNEYVPLVNDIKNTNYNKLMIEHDITISADLNKTLFRNADIKKYNILLEYFKACEEKYMYDEGRAIDLFIDTFNKYGRFDTEKIRLDFIKDSIKCWCVLSVIQALSETEVNDTMLTFASETQGTGKTQFVRLLTSPFESLGLVCSANYEKTTDAKRSRALNFIAIDDELGNRTKAEEDHVKAIISEKTLDYTVKYEEGSTKFKRICNFIATTNNVSYLKNYSRRDFVVYFAETRINNFGELIDELSNPDIVNSIWAWAYAEYMNPNARKKWRQKSIEMQEELKEIQKNYTITEDLIETFLTINYEFTNSEGSNVTIIDLMDDIRLNVRELAQYQSPAGLGKKIKKVFGKCDFRKRVNGNLVTHFKLKRKSENNSNYSNYPNL